MARREISVDELRTVAAEVKSIATRLERAAKEMEEKGLPVVLAHGSTALRTYLPHVFEWALKLETDAQIQSQAGKIGVESGAHYEVRRNKHRYGKKK